MKKLIIMSVLLASSFIYKAADAQVNVNINLGSQPEWGPSGYDHVDYYYMPDLDMYYNVPSRNYTYLQGNRWVTVNSVPAQYRNYDFYKGYKVVVNEQSPWNHNNNYKTRYASYRENYSQPNLRDHNLKVKKTKVVKYKADKYKGQDDKHERGQNGRPNQDSRDGRDVRGNNGRDARNGRS
jgi:hypothetical protein